MKQKVNHLIFDFSIYHHDQAAQPQSKCSIVSTKAIMLKINGSRRSVEPRPLDVSTPPKRLTVCHACMLPSFSFSTEYGSGICVDPDLNSALSRSIVVVMPPFLVPTRLESHKVQNQMLETIKAFPSCGTT
jgi:hypothetical protein